jgi:hypothetical protein
MAHLDLDISDMKPSALVRYDIAQDHNRAKQLLVAAIIASTMIVVLAAMFLTAVQ